MLPFIPRFVKLGHRKRDFAALWQGFLKLLAGEIGLHWNSSTRISRGNKQRI